MLEPETPTVGSRRVVAFLDVLGTEKIVKKKHSYPQKYQSLGNCLLHVTNKYQYEQQTIKSIIGEAMFTIARQVTTFSDCVAISLPSETNAVYGILLDTAILIENMAEFGICLRGGIALGELEHRESYVYGEALIEAHFLERKVAVYPRVIVPYELIEWETNRELSSLGDEFRLKMNADLKKWVRQDNDGLYFVDHLVMHLSIYNDVQKHISYLQQVQDMVVKMIGEDNAPLDIKAKGLWYRNYFNQVLSEFKVKNPEYDCLTLIPE